MGEMIKLHDINKIFGGHRISVNAILCLFGLCLLLPVKAQRKQQRAVKQDDRVYMIHSDGLKYDMFGNNPDAQIVKGHVRFRHRGAHLTCDSAYFYQQSNSVKAFGHVYFTQGDTLSLRCERAFYDGQQQMMDAREHVVLKHRQQTLYTDSLNYDRLYSNAYFFEGGTLVDGKDRLVSDWGEYNTQTRQAKFYFNVRLRSEKRLVTTDTLYYDTRKSQAHVTGPSKITTDDGSVIDTQDGYFDSNSDKAQLFGRSVLTDKNKTITGDSLYYDRKTGESQGFGNVIYTDKENKNSLIADILKYNEKTGNGYATKNALVKDYSQKDTLYMHADTLKLFTFNINTDSVYRMVHAYNKVRAYRTDVQAVCDSLIFSTKDSCLTMYKDPIVWNDNRQLLGEQIKVYMNDSTVREAHVLGQALSIEKVDEEDHYNQISSKVMHAYFVDGALRYTESVGNVKVIYYPTDDKDSSMIGLNYTETDTMRTYLSKDRKLEKVWVPKHVSVTYPMTQIPPNKYKLSEFAWFDNLRPVSKDDIFVWRGKREEDKLKTIKRHAAPLQHFGNAPEGDGS